MDVVWPNRRKCFFDSCLIQSIDIGHMQFKNDVYFKNTTFIRNARFGSSEFKKSSIFDSSIFHGSASFMACEFRGVASFAATEFKGGADFRFSTFGGNGSIQINRDPNEKFEPGVKAHAWNGSASFYDTKFEKANFTRCIFNDAIFNPKKLNDYTMNTLSEAGSLSNLNWAVSSKSLIKLRNYFRDNRHRQKEREITCALERNHQSPFEKIIFDLPFEYGSNLARPFKIVGIIYIVCSFFYFIYFHLSGQYGLKYKVISDINCRKETLVRMRPIYKREDNKIKALHLLIWEEIKLIWWALFFSLMSALNVGFRDVNFGRWIRLLLPGESEFQAYGLIRIVSGIQAILSVLLMALGLFFHYGRFFD